MKKSLLISLLASIGLIGIFYLIDIAPKDNGGNWIMFSFLTICCTYLFLFISILLAGLYIFTKYFNPFWTAFVLTYSLISIITVLLFPLYDSFHSFLVSKYTLFDMASLIIAVVLLVFKPTVREGS